MTMKSQRSFLALFTFSSFAILSSVEAQRCHFPAIFNFGDSNSDTGGLSAAFGQVGPPYGESFFGGPAGRFCDGRLIVDFIAESLGLPYLSAFLDALGSNFSHGANFATAASTIRPANVSLRLGGISPISLDVQSTEFSDFRTRSQNFRNRGGVYKTLLPKANYFSQALYTFDIGQNDLTASYFGNKSFKQVRADVPEIIHEFKNVVKDIYKKGGRYFWIHNTGPIGCLAYVIEGVLVKPSKMDRHGCATLFNEVAQYFNKMLKKAVIELRSLLPKATITYVDVYSVKYEMFAHAKRHGFTRSLRSCCGYGGRYNFNKDIRCGAKKVVKGKELCKEPNKAVVWDGVHYTQAANKFIFDKIINGEFSDPPIPLNMACHRL